jgi:hypothetical protein
MKKISVIFAVVILGIIVTGGCVQQNSNPQPVPLTQQIAPQMVVSPEAVIPAMTVATTPAAEYKTADVVFESNTEPAAGFTMVYPSTWTHGPERLSWPSRASPVYQVTGQDPIRYWKAVYNFSSPDKGSYAHVYFDDVTGTGDYFYNIHTWADGVIRVQTRPYCLDGAGNALDVNYCSDARVFFNPVVISDDPVPIKGSFEARKLVFTSPGDENYGSYTLYLMHTGQMQGYNFTVPDHPEVAVKVYGSAWDFGRGGQAYAIDFSSSADQVNTTADIYNHMIDSFKIT